MNPLVLAIAAAALILGLTKTDETKSNTEKTKETKKKKSATGADEEKAADGGDAKTSPETAKEAEQ